MTTIGKNLEITVHFILMKFGEFKSLNILNIC